VTHVVETAELIDAAKPKPRLGKEFELPIVFAGNKEARSQIERILDKDYALKIVENIRPVLELENTDPARNVIHELFMEHVMSHAPGYNKLMEWTPIPIMPTPAGEGRMFQTIAETYDANVIGVGLGGATTNVYSMYENRFVRTVSANLGMSYSICNVLKEAGTENIQRWLPFDCLEEDLRNRLYNKMIRPTTIPQTVEDLMVEQAVAREALRLGFEHHKSLARPLRGIQRRRTIADIFEQESFEETYIDMLQVSWLAGTGGLLSHAPRRAQSALMLIDGFQPEGVTNLAQDSVFMMPHLGVLSTVHPKAAIEIFEKDCLVRIGVCIAPRGVGREGDTMSVAVHLPDNSVLEEKLGVGSIKRIPLKEGEKAEVEILPFRGGDVGLGSGKARKAVVEGGVVGIILDARGRPLALPDEDNERKQTLIEWFKALDAYPERLYELCGR
jgi:hypothetical protein